MFSVFGLGESGEHMQEMCCIVSALAYSVGSISRGVGISAVSLHASFTEYRKLVANNNNPETVHPVTILMNNIHIDTTWNILSANKTCSTQVQGPNPQQPNTFWPVEHIVF